MEAKEIIKQLGGATKVAQLCEVTKGAVSMWGRNGIPRARLMYLKAVRPEVFAKVSPASTAQPEKEAA